MEYKISIDTSLLKLCMNLSFEKVNYLKICVKASVQTVYSTKLWQDKVLCLLNTTACIVNKLHVILKAIQNQRHTCRVH